MFSGIIEAVGKISQINPLGKGFRLVIDAGELPMDDVAIGDSIAVNGVCLTVVEAHPPQFAVDVSAETLRCTTGFTLHALVNLERALQLSSRLDGHIVIGHVDGVGTITELSPIEESVQLNIEVPDALLKYIANKGSVAINGVSLTTNKIEDNIVEINLIPHTVAATTFHALKAGDRVNMEIDLFARYIERMLEQTSLSGAGR